MKNKKVLLIAVSAILLVCLIVVIVIVCVGKGKNDGRSASETFLSQGNIIDNGVLQIDSGANNVSDGGASLTALETRSGEEENGLTNGLYVFETVSGCDKSVKVTLPTSNGLNEGESLLLGIGLDYKMSSGESERVYVYYESVVKDGSGNIGGITFSYIDGMLSEYQDVVNINVKGG